MTFLTNFDTDKDLVSCVGWTTADELYSSGFVTVGYIYYTVNCMIFVVQIALWCFQK